MNGETRIRRADRAVYRELSGEAGAVILHLDTGAYHGINDVGRLIWEAIGEGASLAHLFQAVRSQTEGFPPGVDEEVEEFVNALAVRALLTIDQSAVPG